MWVTQGYHHCHLVVTFLCFFLMMFSLVSFAKHKDFKGSVVSCKDLGSICKDLLPNLKN